MAALLGAATLGLAVPASAGAANFNVSNTNDVAAQNPASGSCATPSGSDAHGACTLRSAVQAANNVNADSTITLAAGVYKLTIAPSGGDDDSTGDLNITNAPNKLTINGAGSGTNGSVIDGNFTDRVFRIDADTPAEFNNVRIRNGRTGGIGNTTTCPGSPSFAQDGGGIQNNGDLTLTHDVIIGNVAVGHGGGVQSSNNSTLNISQTAVTNNVSCPAKFNFASGGGVNHDGNGDVMIDLSTFSGNSAPTGNGGGYAAISVSDPTDTISRSTFSGNSAGTGGGIDSEMNGGTMTLFADLLTGNTASRSAGLNNTGDEVSVINTTITNNNGVGIGSGVGHTSVSYSTLFHNDGNLQNYDSGTFTIDDTIVAQGGSPGNCPGGAVTANHNNLFDNSGADCSAGATDLKNTDPMVGPLQDNGGPTHIRALLTGSKAINAGDDGPCGTVAKNVDQRGVTRPQGSHCDIGAFEYVAADLALTASADKSQIKPGQQDTFTDVVTNNGPSNATSVVFTDPAAGFHIDSVSTTKGSCTHTKHHVKCQLGSLAKGGKVTIKIKVTADSPGDITMNSSVKAAQQDPKPSNNHATVTVRVVKPPKPPKVGCGRSKFHFVYDTADPHQDDQVTLVKIFFNSHHRRTQHGHNIHTVTIRPRPHGHYEVVVIGYLTDGRRIILERNYHGCLHGDTGEHIEETGDYGLGSDNLTVKR